MKRVRDYFEVISKDWAFVLIAFVGLLFLGIVYYEEDIRWSMAFALCGGLVWAGLVAGLLHFKWARRYSQRGWDDWGARMERTALYTWLALGLTGLFMGIITLMGG